MSVDPCERLSRYINMFKESLKSLRVLDQSSSRVVDLAVSYFKDSMYYYEKGDCITGLVTISYAEGLIDALRNLGMVEWNWIKPRESIVLAAGSFDILHPGHVEFLRWASSLGDKLYVVVSRDENYVKFKGFEPVFRESERLSLVSSIRYVYRAFLGSIDIFDSVLRVKPNIIALGPDQLSNIDFEKELSRLGLDVVVYRMDKKVENYSSSGIKNRVCRVWCRGFGSD